MTEKIVITEVDSDGVGRITLNRPDVHNAFDDVLIAELTAALERMGDDRTVHSVMLAARGKSFSAGADLNWMKRMAAFSFEENVADAMRLAALLRDLNELAKPTIALVQGPAYGGGVGLVAACDVAIAAEETAAFALTEVRLGLIPATISPYVIAAIGRRQAQRYFLTAERFDAVEAVRIGLVHLAVPAVELEGAGRRVAAALRAGGPRALRATKELIRAVAHKPVDEALAMDTAERIARARASEEAQGRIASFLEARARGRS